MNRRTLLATAVALIPLAACATKLTISQVAADINLEAQGLAPFVAALAAVPNIPAATVAKAQSLFAVIQADAKAFAASVANPPAGTVQEVQQAVQGLAAIAATIPALAPYALVIQAAVALLPVMLTAVGVPVVGGAPKMSAAQARAVLAAQ
ncbi:hypothetical protein [Rhodopila sp.]|uniref:hypothetical protein n=1 Tax=Rhodopila sp. TaxID=2480087 RepID=UPI003D106C7A